ncbi:MAG: phosphatidylglycerol:prolipoprotein diacylglycerol transferase [Bradymonadia bacterium]|jgi:phosphatidylglycerol:prolipoprotein diacylglycerol transferase
MIPNYGVAMALGFAVPLAWQIVRARRRGAGPLSTEGSIDLGFWIIVAGVAGARALSWLQHLPHDLPACVNAGQCGDLLRFWSGGLVFYGGVLGSLLAGWFWCKRRDIDFLEAAAEVVPFVALGHAIGRVGCFLTGCCYGGICAHPSPMGVHYPVDSAPFNSATGQVDQDTVWQMIEQGHSIAMHPVQLYEAGAEVLLFASLLWLAHRASPRRVVAAWLMAYGVLRFCLEMIRGDRIRGFWFEWTSDALTNLLNVPQGTSLLLTTSQAIAVVLVVGGIVLWWRSTQSVEAESGAAE